MRAAISSTSAPRSTPTRSTRKSTSSPGLTMPRKRAVQPTRRAGGVARPSVAVTTGWAALGAEGDRGGGGEGEFRGHWGKRTEQGGSVIQVHQAQQAPDPGNPGMGDRRADRGENRRPAAADQRVGNDGQGRGQRRA